MLQCRSGKRTGKGAIKIALDMVNEGLVDIRSSMKMVEPQHLDQLLHPRVHMLKFCKTLGSLYNQIVMRECRSNCVFILIHLICQQISLVGSINNFTESSIQPNAFVYLHSHINATLPTFSKYLISLKG